METLTGHEWARRRGDRIIDQDGWRLDDGVTMDTPITLADYIERRDRSTVRLLPVEPAQAEPRDCTCLGTCRGADGLAPGWRCALQKPAQAEPTPRCRCGHVSVIGGEIIDPGPCPIHDSATPTPEPDPDEVRRALELPLGGRSEDDFEALDDAAAAWLRSSEHQPTAPHTPADTEEVTPEGGRHSLVEFALDVIPTALLRIGAVLYRGERLREVAPQQVGQENWRCISTRMHVRHALHHLAKWLAGDRSEDHLEHAMARLGFAIEREQESARG